VVPNLKLSVGCIAQGKLDEMIDAMSDRHTSAQWGGANALRGGAQHLPWFLKSEVPGHWQPARSRSAAR
jgi:hypothetical protein